MEHLFSRMNPQPPRKPGLCPEYLEAKRRVLQQLQQPQEHFTNNIYTTAPNNIITTNNITNNSSKKRKFNDSLEFKEKLTQDLLFREEIKTFIKNLEEKEEEEKKRSMISSSSSSNNRFSSEPLIIWFNNSKKNRKEAKKKEKKERSYDDSFTFHILEDYSQLKQEEKVEGEDLLKWIISRYEVHCKGIQKKKDTIEKKMREIVKNFKVQHQDVKLKYNNRIVNESLSHLIK